MIEDRLVELEIKISRQEDMLDSLNTVIYQQQKQIDHLKLVCEALARQLKQGTAAGENGNAADEKPPHY